MRLSEALNHLSEGKKVFRASCPSFLYHIEHVDDEIALISENVHFTDCEGVVSVMEVDDIFADDWEVHENE